MLDRLADRLQHMTPEQAVTAGRIFIAVVPPVGFGLLISTLALLSGEWDMVCGGVAFALAGSRYFWRFFDPDRR